MYCVGALCVREMLLISFYSAVHLRAVHIRYDGTCAAHLCGTCDMFVCAVQWCGVGPWCTMFLVSLDL